MLARNDMTLFATRFAPSPTGYLHLGHAYSAFTAFDAAQPAGGRFLLRIEDIDQTRCKPEYETAIMDDLDWLGLQWETPVLRQSERFDAYIDALQTLIDKNVVYRCFKTRKEVAEAAAQAPHFGAEGPDGPQYVGAPLAPHKESDLMDAGAAFAWRLSMARARDALGGNFAKLSFTEEGRGPNGESGVIHATPEIFGDPIVARKDFGTSYHIASVLDDANQEVTHIIRGEDLFPATHLHRLLQALLDLPTPRYRHHRLITDENGKRFAKRDQSVTLRALRESGATPADIRARVGINLGV